MGQPATKGVASHAHQQAWSGRVTSLPRKPMNDVVAPWFAPYRVEDGNHHTTTVVLRLLCQVDICLNFRLNMRLGPCTASTREDPPTLGTVTNPLAILKGGGHTNLCLPFICYKKTLLRVQEHFLLHEKGGVVSGHAESAWVCVGGWFSCAWRLSPGSSREAHRRPRTRLALARVSAAFFWQYGCGRSCIGAKLAWR